jgi:hypothetical protein
MPTSLIKLAEKNSISHVVPPKAIQPDDPAQDFIGL